MCPLPLGGFEPATVLFEAVPEVQLFLSEAVPEVQLFLFEAVPEVQLFLFEAVPEVQLSLSEAVPEVLSLSEAVHGAQLFPSLVHPVASGRALWSAPHCECTLAPSSVRPVSHTAHQLMVSLCPCPSDSGVLWAGGGGKVLSGQCPSCDARFLDSV